MTSSALRAGSWFPPPGTQSGCWRSRDRTWRVVPHAALSHWTAGKRPLSSRSGDLPEPDQYGYAGANADSKTSPIPINQPVQANTYKLRTCNDLWGNFHTYLVWVQTSGLVSLVWTRITDVKGPWDRHRPGDRVSVQIKPSRGLVCCEQTFGDISDLQRWSRKLRQHQTIEEDKQSRSLADTESV